MFKQMQVSIFNDLFIYIYYVSVLEYVHVSARAHIGQKKVSGPQRLELEAGVSRLK